MASVGGFVVPKDFRGGMWGEGISRKSYFLPLCNCLIISIHFWPFLRSLLGKICSLLVFPSSLLRNGGKFEGENRGSFSAAGPLLRPTS